MNVASLLLNGRDSQKVALEFLDRSWTYGELHETSATLALLLLEIGVCRSDRVILAGDNSMFWVAGYIAILRLGAVCVPLSPSLSAEDVEAAVESTHPRACLAQTSFAGRHRISLTELDVITDRCVVSPEARNNGQKRSNALSDALALGFADVAQDDLAALMPTSGSTAKPKYVMVTHGNIRANTESIISYLELSDKERMMCVLPFHYCFGTSLLHTHMAVGATLVVDSRFTYPETVLQRIDEAKCTAFAGVPSHYQILLRKSTMRTRSLPYLRKMQQAGGGLAASLIDEIRAIFPNVAFYAMYGQTEATARLSYLPPDMLERKRGSIGKGIPGVTLRVLNEAGEEVRPSETGQIVAEGSNVTLGYWNAPEESAATFKNGHLYTGDLARVDEDGFIYIVGRAKDFLKCGGKRVSCRYVEEMLMNFPGLTEAAVIGIPDEVLGEAVRAFVVPRDASDFALSGLRAFCRSSMPLQLVPREFVILDALPRSVSGKPLKQALSETKYDLAND